MVQFAQNKAAAHSVVWALGLAAVLVVPAAATAAPIVDGRFDPAEGYASGYSVNFAVEGAGTLVPGGQLWTCQGTTGDVYVAFVQPLTLVDNTYGRNSVGWGPDAPSGKRHNFTDLLGSDAAEFAFTDGTGQVVLDIKVDYLSETSKNSGVFCSLGVSGGDGEVNSGPADSVLEWGTSLDYNFNTLGYVLTDDSPATDANYAENPNYPGWVFEVAYELRVSGDLFRANDFGGVRVTLVHDSPNKIGKNKVYPTVVSEVPEPATMTLLALGAAAILARRQRRAAR